MASKLFKEKQRYRDRLSLAFLGVLAASTLFGTLKSLLQANTNYFNALFLFTIALLAGGLIWWLSRLQLKVAISKKNIKYKLSPIHSKKQVIPWKEIDQYELVETSEAAQWSGGNISFNGEKKISLTGRNGLALKTKQGEQYLIGCSNVEDLKIALQQIDI